MTLTEHDKTRAAAEYVDVQIGFWIHFAAFVLVIALLVAIDWRDGAGWWVQWPALGWGIGVFCHAIAAFGRTPRAMAQWRTRRIERVRSEL